MIQLKQVQKSFGNTQAVKDISLKIKPGEIVGLLGPNGAGKTTTLRMLAGILPPSHGEVTIDGKNFLDHEQVLKQRIGYLPENNPLYEDLTVEEHLHFWAEMKGLEEKKEASDAIDFAVENTGISDVYYRLIGELSKGYRQRVGLAQAILSRPEILIMDEPTEGLDPNQRRDIQALLSSLKKSRTVIVSSHVLGEVAKLANRIVIIHQGQVVGDDSPKNLVKAKVGEQQILVEVEGKAVKSNLKRLDQVSRVEDEGKNVYRLFAKEDKDVRSDVFELAVKKDWTLLMMQPVERQLEDVFSELTE